jgi:hypothetical protein
MLFFGYFYGKLAGKSILINKSNYILSGILCCMAILVTTAFLSSCILFFQEGLEDFGNNGSPFVDYVFKPTCWIFFAGIIPAFLIGIWLGNRIRKRGNKK